MLHVPKQKQLLKYTLLMTESKNTKKFDFVLSFHLTLLLNENWTCVYDLAMRMIGRFISY